MKYAISLLITLLPTLISFSHTNRSFRVILPEVTVTPIKPAQDSIELFARLIHAEAGNQPFDGQVAVANTVIYRSWRKNKKYHDIVFQKGQYDGVRAKSFNKKPTPENYKAAYYALIGYKAVPYEVQYFHNKKIATDTKWIRYLSNFEYRTIGDHTFCYIPKLKPQV